MTEPSSAKPPSQMPSVAGLESPHVLETGGLTDAASPLDELTEKRVDEIEMIGEEEAAGFHAATRSQVSAGMRYLHSSRTIHQLVTDRNRAVGLYLAVASLLVTACGAIVNAKSEVELIVPIKRIQYWCFPFTFGILTVLALFTAFLLIRTRIGLIYEVAKMNVLLGLPVGRVKRIGILSIFFIMHALVSLAGGVAATLLSYFLLFRHLAVGETRWVALAIGFVVTTVLVVFYVVTVLHTTRDEKLTDASK